jgi:DNA-binding HxlR family transcriptional regulator
MPRSSLVFRSSCPIGCSLDLIGDRWTLLVIRDLMLGKSRYGELLDSAERIPTNILADRLARLEDSGIIRSELYQSKPPRYAYQLTEKGHALGPVLASLAQWGMQHVPKTKPNPTLLKQLRESLS